MEPITAVSQHLPRASNVVFPETPKSIDCLPSPQRVREKFVANGGDADDIFRPKPVRYPAEKLLVKRGADVTIAEGQCLWFLHRNLRHTVPVPEIYGWKTDEDQTFLYMELVDGVPLSERWDSSTPQEKADLCKRLSGMLSGWTAIVQPPMLRPDPVASRTGDWFSSPVKRAQGQLLSWWRKRTSRRAYSQKLYQIGGQPLRDIMFEDSGKSPCAAFQTVEEFHKSFSSLLSRDKQPAQDDLRQLRPELSGLRDDIPVVFTHADLDQSNILISSTDNGLSRICAIIDWHQSGWYPEPWEYLKAKSVGRPESDWTKEYVDSILVAPEHDYMYSWEFISMSTI